MCSLCDYCGSGSLGVTAVYQGFSRFGELALIADILCYQTACQDR